MRYLIVRTDFLGDTILSSTFVKMLAGTTEAKIDTLCYSYNQLAFAYNHHIQHKYYLHPKSLSPEQQQHNNKVYTQLKSTVYDAIFMLNRDLKSYKLLKLINSKLVFGHRLGIKSFKSRLFSSVTSFSNKFNYIGYDNNSHEIQNLTNLLNFGLNKMRVINSPILADQYCYFYTENFNPENSNKNLDNHTIVLNISGRSETVRYIPTSLARCIIEDLIKLGKKVLLIATADDRNRAESLINEVGHSDINLCCETNLLNLANILAKHKYFIGADGGLLHLAAGLHMHCIGLFHAQNIQAWHPWTPHQICLQTESKKIYDLTSTTIINALIKLEQDAS